MDSAGSKEWKAFCLTVDNQRKGKALGLEFREGRVVLEGEGRTGRALAASAVEVSRVFTVTITS